MLYSTSEHGETPVNLIFSSAYRYVVHFEHSKMFLQRYETLFPNMKRGTLGSGAVKWSFIEWL